MVEEAKLEETDVISKAYAAAERLEKANKANEELVKRMEILESRKILGGQSTATPPEAVKKEETPKEYAARMMRGGT